MGRGSCRATVHGFIKSWTWLSNWGHIHTAFSNIRYTGINFNRVWISRCWNWCEIITINERVAIFSLEDFHVAHFSTHWIVTWMCSDISSLNFVVVVLFCFSVCSAIEIVTRIRSLLWKSSEWQGMVKPYVVLLEHQTLLNIFTQLFGGNKALKRNKERILWSKNHGVWN